MRSAEFVQWLELGSSLDVVRYLKANDIGGLVRGLTDDYGERILATAIRAGARIDELNDDQLVLGGRSMLNAPVSVGIRATRGRTAELLRIVDEAIAKRLRGRDLVGAFADSSLHLGFY